MITKSAPGFVVTLRAMHSREGRKRVRGEVAKALAKAVRRDPAGLAEPIIEWSRRLDAIAVDIDCPAGAEPLPENASVENLFPEHLPRPLAGWRTHHGGLRAIFVAVEGPLGIASALALASTWYQLAPLKNLARWPVELLTHTRHPAGDRPDGGRCGPISWFTPSADLVVPHGQARAAARPEDVARFMEQTGFWPGRHSTKDCPMPGCGMMRATSGNLPIVVDELRGIRCFRCDRDRGWDELVGEVIPSDRPTLREAARQLVHFSHQKHILGEARPNANDEMLAAAWRKILLTVNADRVARDPSDRPVWLPRIRSAASNDVPLVRGVGHVWLQAGTLEPRTKLTKTTASALPWTHDPFRVDEAQDAVTLSGFTLIQPVNASAVVGPFTEAPPGSILVRRDRRPGEPPLLDLSVRPSAEAVEGSWVALEEALPGINCGYFSALISSVFFAQLGRGFPPLLVVGGESGAGKTALQRLAGAAVGAPAVEIALDDEKTTMRNIGIALESGAGLLYIDEIGRSKDMYSRLASVLKLNASVRFEAKYRNPITIPFRVPLSLLGSTLPIEVLRAPEVERRTIAFWLQGRNAGWDRNGDLGRARESTLRAPLDIVVADLWWALRDTGPSTPWRASLMERFGAVSVTELDFDDEGGEGRAACIRGLYRIYCDATPADLYTGAGFPEWLQITPGTRAWTYLEQLIDTTAPANVRHAQTEDIKRQPLGPILGFNDPPLRLHIQQRSARWIVKFVQPGKRGDGRPRSELPNLPADGGASPGAAAEEGDESRTVAHELRTAESATISELRTIRTCGTDELRSQPLNPSAADRVSERAPCVTCVSGATALSARNRDLPAGTGRPIIIDFETRSLASLRELGGRAYAQAASTEVICAVALLPEGTEVVWRAGDPEPSILFRAVRAGASVAAHNWSGFDCFIWRRLRWPAPSRSIDTAKLARLAGLPGDLEAVGELLGFKKAMDGREYTLALSLPDRTGCLPPLTREQVEPVVDYCRRDVAVTAKLLDRLAGVATPTERAVQEVDGVVNERGFGFDVELARALLEVTDLIAVEDDANLPVALAVLRSPAKLTAWLRQQGVDVPNVQRGQLEHLLEDDLPLEVRRVLEARIGHARITKGKVNAGLRRVSEDGRLRDLLRYHQAHTGRWSAAGLQPHNLPRGVDIDIELAVDAVLARDVDRVRRLAADAPGAGVADVLATLVRACIIPAPGKLLAVVDYASIEARGLAWLAGDEDKLEAFRGGDDVYARFASRLFGLSSVDDVTKAQRQLGKVAELGCGYQMGAERFESHARGYGVDWEQSPLTPQEVVDAWRDGHPLIAGTRTGEFFNGHPTRTGGLWRQLHRAFDRVVRGGGNEQVARVLIERAGDDVHIQLPGGRCLVYPGVRIELTPTKWGEPKEGPTYRHRGSRTSTYGGKLAENVVQALCRDLLAEALVRLENAGVAVGLHVHDEVLAEVDTEADLERVERLMGEVPGWAEGLPIDVSGFTCLRYRK